MPHFQYYHHFHDITHKILHLLFFIMHDEQGNPFQEDQQSPDLRSLPSEYTKDIMIKEGTSLFSFPPEDAL